MATKRTIEIFVRLDGSNASKEADKMADQITDDLKKTGAQVKDTGKDVDKFGDTAEESFRKTGTSAVAAGNLVAQFAADAIRDIARFGGTIADNTVEYRKNVALVGNLGTEIGGITNQIQGMDAVLGDQTELLQAYFKVYSGGVTDTTDSVDLLRDAARLSFAEQAELTSTVQAGIKIWNIYGSELDNTTQAFETLSAIAQIGDTNLESVAGTISRLLPSGKALGLSLAEVGGTLAILTQVSGSTEIAVTNLTSLFRAVNNESTAAVEAAKELQIEWSGAAVQAQGITGFLGTLKTALDKTGKSEAENSKLIQDLTGSAEAANALLPLLGDSFEKLEGAIDQTANSTDIITGKFDRMEDAIGPVVELENAWTNMQIELGEEVAPTLLEITTLFIDLLPIIKNLLAQLPLIAAAAVIAFGPQIVTAIGEFTLGIQSAGLAMKALAVFAVALIAIDIAEWFFDQGDAARRAAVDIRQEYLDALAMVNDEIENLTRKGIQNASDILLDEGAKLRKQRSELLEDMQPFLEHIDILRPNQIKHLENLNEEYIQLGVEVDKNSRAVTILADKTKQMTARDIAAAKAVAELAAKTKAEAEALRLRLEAQEAWKKSAKEADKIFKTFKGIDEKIADVNQTYDEQIRILRQHKGQVEGVEIAVLNMNIQRDNEIKKLRESTPLFKALLDLQKLGIEFFKQGAEVANKAREAEEKLNKERKENLVDLTNRFGSFGQRLTEINDHYQTQRDRIMALDNSQVSLVDRFIMLALVTKAERDEIEALNAGFDEGITAIQGYVIMLGLLANTLGNLGTLADQLNLPGGELFGDIAGGLGGIQQGVGAWASVAESGLTGLAAGLAKFNAALTIGIGVFKVASSVIGPLLDSKRFDGASAARFVQGLGIDAPDVIASIQAEIAKLREAGVEKFAARDIAKLHGIPQLIEAAGRLEQVQLDQMLWQISFGVDALGNSWKAWADAVPATMALLDQVDRGFVSWTEHLGDVVSAIVQTGNASAEMIDKVLKNAPDQEFIRRLFDDIVIGAEIGDIGEDLFIKTLSQLLDAVVAEGIEVEDQILRIIKTADDLGFSLSGVAAQMVELIAEGLLAWSEPIEQMIMDVFAAGEATDELMQKLSSAASDEQIRGLFQALADGAEAGSLSIGQLTKELTFLLNEAEGRGLDIRNELLGIIGAAKRAGFELTDFTSALDAQLQFEKDTLRGIRDDIQAINSDIVRTADQIKGIDKSVSDARLSAFKQRQFVLPEARQTLQETVGADTFQRIQISVDEMTKGLTETLTFKEMKELTLSVDAANQQAVLAFLETINQTVRLDQQIVELIAQKELAIEHLAELRDQKEILKAEAREIQKNIRGVRRDIKWIQNHWDNIRAVDNSVDSIDIKMDTNNELLGGILEQLENIPKFADGGMTAGGLVVTHPGEFIVAAPAVQALQGGASLSFPSAPSQAPVTSNQSSGNQQPKQEINLSVTIKAFNTKDVMESMDEIKIELMNMLTEVSSTSVTNSIDLRKVD